MLQRAMKMNNLKGEMTSFNYLPGDIFVGQQEHAGSVHRGTVPMCTWPIASATELLWQHYYYVFNWSSL